MSRPTAIVAEDEPLLRGELKDALAALWPELEIVAEAEDGLKAIQALASHKPDVIFLDIQMPGMTGLDVARVASGKCHVVFVTAYDQYAVAAFDQGAVDYVMKPFSSARLAIAIDRIRERMNSTPANLEGLLKSLAERSVAARQFLRWISVAEGRTVRLITTDQICYFQADNKYTVVVTAAAQSLINKTIRELVDELDPEIFLQIHRGIEVPVRRWLSWPHRSAARAGKQGRGRDGTKNSQPDVRRNCGNQRSICDSRQRRALGLGVGLGADGSRDHIRRNIRL